MENIEDKPSRLYVVSDGTRIKKYITIGHPNRVRGYPYYAVLHEYELNSRGRYNGCSRLDLIKEGAMIRPVFFHMQDNEGVVYPGTAKVIYSGKISREEADGLRNEQECRIYLMETLNSRERMVFATNFENLVYGSDSRILVYFNEPYHSERRFLDGEEVNLNSMHIDDAIGPGFRIVQSKIIHYIELSKIIKQAKNSGVRLGELLKNSFLFDFQI